jgi:imidazolonepropionase-like amidohydrolase
MRHRRRLRPSPSTRIPIRRPITAIRARPTVIRGATIYDGEGGQIDNGTIVLADGLVQAIGGPETAVPAGAFEIDGHGKWVTPGVIDVHSHLGDYPSPGTEGNSDGNEATAPARPDVWAEHSVWPQDPGFSRALANGGVTALQILPGSANLFGGRSVTLKNVSARTVQGMKFPGAPYGLKMACGENPKRVYGNKGGPSTRMGNIAYPRHLAQGAAYKRKWDKYEKDGGECLSATWRWTRCGRARRQDPVHNHCYRADEMAIMIDLSQGVRLQDHRLPPRRRELQNRRSAGEMASVGDVGRLVGLQDGSL